MGTMTPDVVGALAAQQALLAGLLDGLTEDEWQLPSPCEGWSVADVVVHVAQTNELAVASASGRLGEAAAELGWTAQPGDPSSVDDAAERAVVGERGASGASIGARWRQSADDQLAALSACDASDRVPWVTGTLSARTLATTRLSETWIHSRDVAEALGRTFEPPEGALALIARLAWRTLPYAFSLAGRTMTGPVAVTLDDLSFVPTDGPAVTTVEGPLQDWCLVAARRLEPAATSLRAEGPDADAVLELVRTYA